MHITCFISPQMFITAYYHQPFFPFCSIDKEKKMATNEHQIFRVFVIHQENVNIRCSFVAILMLCLLNKIMYFAVLGLIFNPLWEKCVVLLYLEFTNRQPFKKNEFMNDIPEQNKHRKLNPFSIWGVGKDVGVGGQLFTISHPAVCRNSTDIIAH